LCYQDDSVEGRARAAEEVLTRIRRLPGDFERNLYVKRLADLTRLDETLLLSKLSGGSSPSAVVRQPRRTPSQDPAAPRPTQRPALIERSQLFLLRLMTMDDPKIRVRVREEGTRNLFVDELYRGVADHLLERQDADGRLLEDLVDDHLTEAQQSLLAGVLLDDDQGWVDVAERIFSDCRRAVSHSLLKARLRELDKGEAEARQRGDDAAVAECQQERVKINTELKKKL
jgi:DNA primase